VWTDQAARVLIEAALELAVEQAKTPRTKVYLQSVERNAKGDDVLVSRLMARLRYVETPDPAKEAAELKQLWEKRLGQLSRFVAAATVAQEEFKRRIEGLSPPKISPHKRRGK
jgi:hypothetical protein